MPRPPLPGKKLTLLYNSKAGPLKWIEDKRTNKDKSEFFSIGVTGVTTHLLPHSLAFRGLLSADVLTD
jgi:hypothetical protein